MKTTRRTFLGLLSALTLTAKDAFGFFRKKEETLSQWDASQWDACGAHISRNLLKRFIGDVGQVSGFPPSSMTLESHPYQKESYAAREYVLTPIYRQLEITEIGVEIEWHVSVDIPEDKIRLLTPTGDVYVTKNLFPGPEWVRKANQRLNGSYSISITAFRNPLQ